MYSFEYLDKDTVLAKVYIDGDTVVVENYTNDVIDKPFGNCENPTIDNVKELFLERCFPETRVNAKQILRSMGIDYYDPYRIIRKTHGVLIEDCYWIRFSDEDVCWKDVNCVRNF